MFDRRLILLALVSGGLQFLFFVYVGIFPISSVGDPSFDRPMLRLRYWEASYQSLLFLATALSLAIFAVRSRERSPIWMVVLALGALLTAHLLILGEHWIVDTSRQQMIVDRSLTNVLITASRWLCPILTGVFLWIALVQIRRVDTA